MIWLYPLHYFDVWINFLENYPQHYTSTIALYNILLKCDQNSINYFKRTVKIAANYLNILFKTFKYILKNYDTTDIIVEK